MLSFSRLSEDMGLTFCLDRSGKVVRTVGTASAMSTDRQMVKTYKGLLTSVGNTTKKMVVDPSMPYGLEKGVTDGFESVWPEIEKEMCDRFILTNGFSFGTYRKQFQAHTPSQPTSCFQAVVGTLLHATQPYDLSFFGRLRNPLYFAVFMNEFVGISHAMFEERYMMNRVAPGTSERALAGGLGAKEGGALGLGGQPHPRRRRLHDSPADEVRR